MVIICGKVTVTPDIVVLLFNGTANSFSFSSNLDADNGTYLRQQTIFTSEQLLIPHLDLDLDQVSVIMTIMLFLLVLMFLLR